MCGVLVLCVSLVNLHVCLTFCLLIDASLSSCVWVCARVLDVLDVFMSIGLRRVRFVKKETGDQKSLELIKFTKPQ